MQSFLWYILRFAGKITFLLCASKFLSPEFFVQLQTFTIIGETIVFASSSATAIFMSQQIAKGKKENYYWTINMIELALALGFIAFLFCLMPLITLLKDLSILIVPFIITSLYLNLHYRYIIITRSSLIESQKFLILYEVLPYIASASIMVLTNSFEYGILTFVIFTGCSIILWNHPEYSVSKDSVVYFFKFLKKMYVYTLLTFGFKTIERVVIIEKFYLDSDLAAFLFYSKFWILGATILIGFRGAKIVSSLSQIDNWAFLKHEFIYIIAITGILLTCVFILSINLESMDLLRFASLSNGIDSATFISTGVYCVCLALYSISVMVAEIRCTRNFMYAQTLFVMFGLILIFYFSNSLFFYLSCVSALLLCVSTFIAIEIRKYYA